MALDERSRQKKLAKKAAKHKAKLTARKVVTGSFLSQTKQFVAASNAPVYECFVAEGLFDLGLGSVAVSRKMPGGNIALSVFLLDVFCLGVKNAFFGMGPKLKYDEKIMIIKRQENLKSIDHTCARKLVEEAEAYAGDLGFSPHKDYQIAKKIFGDIDPEACPMCFEFGQNGKPFFVSGPNDNPARCKKIIDTLRERCGPDGFHFMVSTPGGFI